MGAVQIANSILLRNKVNEFPIRLDPICRKEGIRLFSYREGWELIKKMGLEKSTEDNPGFCIGKLIFYDDTEPLPELRFTVAHELGHIMCGHTLLRWRDPDKKLKAIPSAEREASAFAISLLAPLSVLYRAGIRSSEEIADICDISITYARSRCKTLSTLEVCGAVPQNDGIVNNFMPYIVKRFLKF